MEGGSRNAPRRRAFSHKVTTGCLTCKKRRKKCDEEKPTCRRCSRGGYICDGYEPANGDGNLPPLASNDCDYGFYVSPRLLLPANHLESYFYGHFFARTIHDLHITPCLNASFWRRMFAAPSQDTRCVWHATIAFGITHWLYIRPTSRTSYLDAFAISQYNLAISELRPVTSQTQSAPTNFRDLLICCFMFVNLECLRGNYGDAMRHLESGSRLLTTRPIQNPSSSKTLRELAAMFHAISSQVSLFSDDRPLPDLSPCMIPMKKYCKTRTTFRDLDEAEDILNTFDDELMHIRDIDQNWDDKDSECNKQWVMLRSKVKAWGIEFAALLKNPELHHQNESQRERTVNLKIQHRIWELHVEGESPDDLDSNLDRDEDQQGMGRLSPSECFVLLREVDKLWTKASGPEFGLKIDLITGIFQLYGYCPDPSARQWIIAILRSRKRREIVWDSQQLADYLEAHLVSQQNGIETSFWPDIGPSIDSNALITFRPYRSYT